MTDTPGDILNILLAEDNEDDIFVVRRAIDQCKHHTSLDVAADGKALLDMLEQIHEDGSPLPSLIVVDINMPRMDGYQVTRSIKEDERFRAVPVIVLTTSNRAEDVEKAFAHGACSFLTKPAEFIDLVQLMNKVLTYWTSVTALPQRTT